MQSNRLQKLNQLIQEELSDIFEKKIRPLLPNHITTITEVKVTPDVSIAKVYISIYPTNERQKIFEEIKEHKSFFRKQLGNRLRHQLRIIPDLHFYMDDTLDKVEELEKALSGKLNNPLL